MKNPAPAHLSQAFKNYDDAVEQLKRVSHVLDRQFLGRAATPAELDDVKVRGRAKENALHKIAAWPCADFSGLRSKAKFLAELSARGETLSGADQRAFFQSILQMAKTTIPTE